MPFRVTMTLGDAELGKVLARFSKSQLANLEIIPVSSGGETPKKKAVKRSTGSTILMRGNKAGAPASAGQRALLILHEKMEAKYGIGNVTKKLFTDRAVASKFSKHQIARLVTQGWLEYI